MSPVLSEVDRLSRVAVKHPRDAFIDQQTIARQWQELRFTAEPDLGRASREHDRFIEALSAVAEVHLLPRDETTTLDSIYVRDASIVCDRGLILWMALGLFIVNVGLMWVAVRLFDRETILTRWK